MSDIKCIYGNIHCKLCGAQEEHISGNLESEELKKRGITKLAYLDLDQTLSKMHKVDESKKDITEVKYNIIEFFNSDQEK